MKIIVKLLVLICDGFSLFFFSVQRLIVIGNGKAKWDGDVIDGQNGRVENAFSTSDEMRYPKKASNSNIELGRIF